MTDYPVDICNCPECEFFNMDAANGCALPERITIQDISRIKGALCSCHCVNPRLWEFHESLGVER